MARYLLLSLAFLLVSVWGMAQTSIAGKVTDVDTNEDLIGANVILYDEGVYITGTSTDFDGNYKTTVDPGTYDVEVSYIGFPTNKITGVVIKAGQNNKLDVQLGGEGEGIDLDVVVVKEYKVPLIEKDNTTSGGVITGEQIRNLPTKNISALAATTAGLSAADDGDDVSVRGSRADGTDYYIDGIRVRGSGSMIPQSEIDQLQVITGGIEAQYGDVTGGIISITTKGPSGKFSGGLELETSEYLDDYGYNLISANISGPILKRKSTGESIIGFRFSGQYRSLKDDDPAGSDIFQVKDDVLAELEANPIVAFGTAGRVPAGQFLTNEDVNVLGYQPNEEEVRLDLTGKIDARLSKAIDITLTGSYSDREDRFTPRENLQTGNNWRVFNTHNNPIDNEQIYRGNFRFRHRLGKVANAATTPEEGAEAQKTPLFSNVQYTLMGGYEKRAFERGDHRHKDNLFNYGYIGQFDYQWDPAFAIMPDEQGRPAVFHVDYTQNFTGYTPGTQNPVLANYNGAADQGDINTFSALNGFFNGNVQEVWDNHINVGQVYNLYQKIDEDRITVNVTSSFDLNPGGSDKGTHSIQFGILYEQRFNSGYDLAPRSLWRIARQQSNRNILGINAMDSVGYLDSPFPQIQDSVIMHPIIAVSESGLNFGNSLRGLLNSADNEFVNVDGVSPDQLSLSMFSAQELNDQFALIDLDYYGFSYTGEKLSNDVTFDDFFTSTVSATDNTRTFPVPVVQPNYAAAYIQDKFSYKDIIFRLGLRVDRYDANTKVLKDPYSLYEVMSASDFHPLTGEPRPDAVQDDYRVYVADEDSDKVVAYRQGDQWYNEEGAPVNDGRLIFGGGVVTPKLYEERVNDIKDRDFDPNTSFEDYEPQINWMPRMAFSFPISDAANFFAHYDILVQRPSALGVNIDRATALDYFYWEESSLARVPNANLKPQRTIDYEVGFQQKLSNSSALKIAVYYKEMRDMIQRRNYLFIPAPVTSYETFGNLDFGTVKGFTFQYDLRRTGNVTFNANYTLQFADGTGSDADGRRGITNRGVIRTLFPLNFDERHRIVSTIDYRYGSGSRYNGPTVGGKDILSDFGVNLQAIAVSGRPYTKKQQAIPLDANGTEGQVNGARLPWNFTLNLRVDKNFKLTKPGAKNKLGLNVYFRVQNLLDARNIVRVYPLTGSPDDDGYLSSPAGIQRVNDVTTSGLDTQSFIDAYQWRVLNPNFFSLPRRMYLGALLEF